MTGFPQNQPIALFFIPFSWHYNCFNNSFRFPFKYVHLLLLTFNYEARHEKNMSFDICVVCFSYIPY